MELVDVTAVKYVRDYIVWLKFEVGIEGEIDLAGSLRGPVFEPLRDLNYFRQVRVDAELGTIVWPNGADLDPLVLHGDFEPASRLAHH